VHPDLLQRGVGRQLHLVDRVALGHLVLVDDVTLQLVELHLGQEDVVGDVMGAAQSAAELVVGKDRLEARPMSVEKRREERWHYPRERTYAALLGDGVI